MADRTPDRPSVGLGCAAYLALYGLAWLVWINTGSVVLAPVMAGAGVVAGLVLAVAGRTPRERGLGVGALLGAAIALLTFAACFALLVRLVQS